MSGGSDFRPASMQRNTDLNLYCELSVNLGIMLYHRNVIRVVMGMDKLVPIIGGDFPCCVIS